MDIGFKALFDGHLAVREESDRRRHPLEFVDRDLFTFIDSSTDLEGTCHGTKKFLGPFSRRVDRVGGNTDSYNSPTDHPHSLEFRQRHPYQRKPPRRGEAYS